jgi:rhomboid family GlyGly-CTERM serine protease
MGLAAWFLEAVPQASGLFQYDRAAIAAGEYWRLLTGHWTHWNGEHLLWDAVVFVCLGAVCEGFGRRSYLAFVASAALLVSLTVWIGLPRMELYRGLSGLDAGLYLMVLLIFLRNARTKNAPAAAACFTLLLTAFIVKVGYELVTGNTIFVNNGGTFVPVPAAHLAGAAAGAAVAWWAGKTGRSGGKRAFRKAPAASPPCGRTKHTAGDGRRPLRVLP